MKAKILKMAILLAALLAAGYMKAGSANAPWCPEALAEQVVNADCELDVGSASVWNKDYLEIIDALNVDVIAICKEEKGGLEMCMIQAGDVGVSAYTADRMAFLFHEDRLCMYGYRFDSQSTETRFDYMFDALHAKYGAATKLEFSIMNLGCCDLIRNLSEHSVGFSKRNGASLNWMESIMEPFVDLYGEMPEMIYQWNVDGHTRISLFYRKKSSVFDSESFCILYANNQPHGSMWDIKAEKEEHNTSGL